MFLVKIVFLIELAIILAVILGMIVIPGVFIMRYLGKKNYSINKSSAKFDIELRKAYNVVLKNVEYEGLDLYKGKVIKHLSLEEKKSLIELIKKAIDSLEKNEDNFYVFEAYERLVDERRKYDIKVLEYNKVVSVLPFIIFAKIMNYQKRETYYKKVDEYDQQID